MLDLPKLVSVLIGAGLRTAAQAAPDPALAGAPTTIRLSPEARAFYGAQAEAFGGMSASAFIAMTLEGVMRATQGVYDDQPQSQMRRRVELMRDRLLHLLRVHELDPPTAAALLADYGVTLSSFHDETSLIDKMIDPLVDFVAGHFHVSRQWLTGVDDGADPMPYLWYKETSSAIRRLAALAVLQRRPRVLVVRRQRSNFAAAFEHGDEAQHEPIGILVSKQRHLNNQQYTTYEHWEFQRWNYEKCRHYFKALLLWIERINKLPEFHHTVDVTGIELDTDVIDKLEAGQLLPIEVYNIYRRSGHPIWYPDDLVDPRTTSEPKELDVVRESFVRPGDPQQERLLQEIVSFTAESHDYLRRYGVRHL